VAATYTRLPALVLLTGIVVALLLDAWKKRKVAEALSTVGMALVCLAAFLVWFLVWRSQASVNSNEYLKGMETRNFNVWAVSWWTSLAAALGRFPSALCESITGQRLYYVNLVPTALVLIGGWSLARQRQFLVLFPVILYIGMLTFLGEWAVSSRYMLPIMPLLVYAMLVGVHTTGAVFWKRELVKTRVTHLGWALPAVVILCAGISLPKIVREIYQMRQTQFYATYDGGQWKDYVQVGAYLGERGRPATDRFLAWLNQGVLSYLSGLRSPPEPLRGIFREPGGPERVPFRRRCG
jgi:hypothetical protein